MSLVKLEGYQTVSEKMLLQAFNSMLSDADANFMYTLNQLQFSLPNAQPGDVGRVLAVLVGGASPIYEYKDVNSLANLQTLFNNRALESGVISITTPFEFTLNSNVFPLADFSIIGRSGFGAGAVKNKVVFTQTSMDGDLSEEHLVGSFSLTSNTVNLTANTGQVILNKLRVGDYVFPSKAGSVGSILQMGVGKILEFVAAPDHIQSATTYTLKETKPLVLYGNESRPSLAFNDESTGLFFTGVLSSVDPALKLKMNSATLFSASYPSAIIGSTTNPYLKFESATILATTDMLVSESAYEGSLWYDKSGKALVVVAANGERLFIKGQAVAAAVNTQESKDFVMQPSAALVLGGGTEQAPTLKVGSAGIVGSGPEMQLVINAKAVAKLTESGLQSPAGSTATAKIVLDDSVGINNPSTPVYTFANSDRLGIYRSNLDAMAVAVKGVPVVEFTELGLDVKSSKVANVAAPTEPKDAANKEYVDSIMPYGNTPGALAMVNSAGSRYVESGAKYFAGTMELKSQNTNTALKLVSASGGSLTIKTPATSQHATFTLPSNQLNNGILQVDSLGNTAWVSKESVTTGLLKADGSVPMTAGVKVSTDTSKDNPLIASGTAGIYASDGNSAKVGFTAQGRKLIEVDSATKTLSGSGTAFNAPFIRLDSTLSNYTALATDSQLSAAPTYSFIGEPNTGIGQTTIQGVSMLVAGSAKLTANETGVIAHSNRIQNVGTPVQNKDAATKEYVDNAVKNPVEISFLVGSLPVGWSSGSSLILSLYDKALIYQSSSVSLTYESGTDPATVVIPSNFNTNAKCQVYVENMKLLKMAKTNGVRQAAYLSNRAILLNYGVQVGQIITIQIAE